MKNSCRTFLLSLFILFGLNLRAQTILNWAKVNSPPFKANELVPFGNKLFALTDHGLYSSADSGITWIVATGILGDGRTGNFQVVVRDTTIFAMAFAWYPIKDGFEERSVFFRSTDKGISWDSLDWKWNEPYQGILRANKSALFRIEGGMTRSTDDGSTWTDIDSGLFNNIGTVNFVLSDSVLIIVADSLYQRLNLISTDLGNSWRHVILIDSLGWPEFAWNNFLFASTLSGSYRSSDFGLTWTKISGIPSLVSGQTFVAGRDRFAMSSDQGTTWYLTESIGLPSNFRMFDFTIADRIIYADGFLYVKDSITKAIDSFNIIYRTTLPVVISDVHSPAQGKYINPVLFPNPVSSTATIFYSLPASEKVTVTIYDAFGRNVAQPISDELQSEGAHELSIDLQNLPAGIYSGRLTAGGEDISSKFVILH